MSWKKSIALILPLGIFTLFVGLLAVRIQQVPPFERVRAAFKPSGGIVLDRAGRVLDEMSKPGGPRRLDWVPLERISPAFLAVFESSLVGIPDVLADGPLKTLALRMSWNRVQVTEASLNLFLMKKELEGLAAVSHALFDVAPLELTRSQSAVILSLIEEPGRGIKDTVDRACDMLRDAGVPEDCAQLGGAHLARIERSYQIRPFTKLAPHVHAHLPKDRGTVRHSTLDRDLQWLALHTLQKAGFSDGAMVILDNASGDVLAYVGSLQPLGTRLPPDQATALKKAGSTIKPFIYTEAFEEHILTTDTVLPNSPLERKNTVRVREAVHAGLDLPAIRLLEWVGVEDFAETMRRLGVTSIQKAGVHGLSMALGSPEVRLLEMTNAYRALANMGMWSPLRFSRDEARDLAPARVFSESAAYIVSDFLKDESTPQYFVFAKATNSCLGFSEKYTVGIWTANVGADAAWLEVMRALHAREPSRPPRPPEGLKDLAEIDEPKLPSRISYPQDKALIAFDPDLAQDNHRLFIQITAPRRDQNLYLNGRRLGRARNLQPWEPESGHHTLELRDSSGQVIHRVRFEVRGRRFARFP